MASKRLRAVNANQGEDLKVDMSPMIDMVFLLLIFFLVNASLVIVKMDKKIEVPVAKNSQKQEEKLGRIVINVYGEEHVGEGRYRMEDGETIFPDDQAIVEFIKEQKEKISGTVVPKLHLRGDRNTEFKHCRRVIRLAAQAGVDQVVFASYATSKQYAN
ncbi:MAG: biopolymer transporter ExbD [Verrucomicrobiota bacterium]